MKFRSMAVVGTLLAAALIPTVGVTAASAHTPSAWSTCEALHVDASYYESKPAVGEPTISNPDYVPGVPGVPAVGTPTITVEKPNPDYVPATDPQTVPDGFIKWNWTGGPYDDGVPGPPPGKGWHNVGHTNDSKGATPGVVHQGNGKASFFYYEAVTKTIPGTPAVGEPTIKVEVDNPDYVPAIPGKDAVGEPTIANPDYTPGDDTPNSVVVTIDGDTVASEEFGSSYSETFPFASKYEAHEWSVTITAWNDPDGSKGWTKTITGTSTPCDVPVVPANPMAELTAVCGIATVTLTNPENADERNQTASFVVEVDGEFYEAYAVTGGSSQVVVIPFAEDSGEHTVEVFQAGTSEWKSIAQGTVPSDCIVPQPEDDVVTEQTVPTLQCDAVEGDVYPTTTTITRTPYFYSENGWVPGEATVTVVDSEYVVTAEDVAALEPCPVTPPVDEEEPTTPVKPANVAKGVAPSNDSALAQTGGEVAPWVIGGGLAALIAGGLLLARRRSI